MPTDRKQDLKDHISPYKIALLVALREQIKFIESMSDEESCSLMLIVFRLFQAADMDFKSFFTKLDCAMSSQCTEAVKSSLDQLCSGTIHLLHELIEEAPSSMLHTPYKSVGSSSYCHTTTTEPFILKNTFLGLFIRRLVLSFEKMPFHEVGYLYTDLCEIYKRSFPPERSCINRYNLGVSDKGFQNGPSSWAIESDDQLDAELSSDERLLTNLGGEEGFYESKKYSRKQAEYFAAQQASLLNHNDSEALSAKELHARISEILKSNPNFAEAHYLRYMNYLRLKECNASMDSLVNYFDRVLFLSGNPGDSRSKVETDEPNNPHSYRYAALNVASMAYRFGHRKEALSAILECIKISQQNNDSVCLQHALGWLQRLDVQEEGSPTYLLERLIESSYEYRLPELASMGCQLYAKQTYMMGCKPSLVFENMMVSDVTNRDHSLAHMSCSGLAQKAALWNVYGRDDMGNLSSQMLLNMKGREMKVSLNGESQCLALCHTAWFLCLLGGYDTAWDTIETAKKRFPQMGVISHIWILSEQRIKFQMTLLQGQFGQSDRAVKDMAAVNSLESTYCRCLYLAETGELMKSMELLNLLIDRCKMKIKGATQVNHLLIRCLLLKGNICCTFKDPTPGMVSIVTASMLAKDHHCSQLEAVVAVHVAFIQLKMGMFEKSLKVISEALPVILNSSDVLEKAKALFFYVRCWLANAGALLVARRRKISSSSSSEGIASISNSNASNNSSGTVSVCDSGVASDGYQSGEGAEFDASKKLILSQMIPLMTEVCDMYSSVNAYHRLKNALLFQALLYNEVGMIKERNRTCLSFNQLSTSLATNSSTVKFCSSCL